MSADYFRTLGVAVLESQLYGIAPHDAATLAAGLIGLLAAGGLASDLPGLAGHASRHRSRAAERVSRGWPAPSAVPIP